jgi:hypothetical protein
MVPGQMLAAALLAEVAAYVDAHADQVDEDGHRLVVRNGHHQPAGGDDGCGRGGGPCSRGSNDRRVDASTGERMRFSSAILPAWARKSPQVAEVLPLPCLHGLSQRRLHRRAGAVPRLRGWPVRVERSPG